MSAQALPVHKPIPVSIFGGYLGAGKTTLVNHLLRHADGLRFTVLVNDFGDLPIDADLIESRDDNIISIAGGCVCCSFGSDLIGALFSIRDMDPRPDHLFIEASGVALPGMVAESISLVADFKLDSIVVLADAENVHQRSQQKYSADTIFRQLSAADLIVLNKCDLANRDAIAATETWIKSEFPGVAWLRTERAELPLHLLSDRHMAQVHSGSSGRSTTMQPGHHPIYHSAVLEFAKGVDPVAVAQQLAHAKHQLLRSKGHVLGANGVVWTVQTVGRRFEVYQAAENTRYVGKIVVIAAQELPALSELADSIGCLGTDHCAVDLTPSRSREHRTG